MRQPKKYDHVFQLVRTVLYFLDNSLEMISVADAPLVAALKDAMQTAMTNQNTHRAYVNTMQGPVILNALPRNKTLQGNVLRTSPPPQAAAAAAVGSREKRADTTESPRYVECGEAPAPEKAKDDPAHANTLLRALTVVESCNGNLNKISEHLEVVKMESQKFSPFLRLVYNSILKTLEAGNKPNTNNPLADFYAFILSGCLHQGIVEVIGSDLIFSPGMYCNGVFTRGYTVYRDYLPQNMLLPLAKDIRTKMSSSVNEMCTNLEPLVVYEWSGDPDDAPTVLRTDQAMETKRYWALVVPPAEVQDLFTNGSVNAELEAAETPTAASQSPAAEAPAAEAPTEAPTATRAKAVATMAKKAAKVAKIAFKAHDQRKSARPVDA